MIEYSLYRFGFFLANTLPLKLSYFLATIFASVQYCIAVKDRRAVIKNIKQVSGKEKGAFKAGLKMYVNFGFYLVDFFRFVQLDEDFLHENVEVIGREHVDEALKRGKGIIALTAHLGNWELGGAITAIMGYEIAGVALPHKDKRVNDFFNSQRNIKGLEVIPVGVAVRRVFKNLKGNKIVALLGDRDFSDQNFGMPVKFFGKITKLPQGPASFAIKTGAAIVPGFMLRKKGNKFKLVFDKPIYPQEDQEVTDESVINFMREYMPILERYIKENLTQWFVFREFWS